MLGPCNGKIVVEGFRKKTLNEAVEIASLDLGARNPVILFHQFIESIS